MLNQSYRIKTLLNAPIKNLGASLTGHKACAGGLLNKTISAFDIQSFDFESTFKVFNSVSNTTSRPERKLQQIFSNTCTLNKSFRHKTFMTGKFQEKIIASPHSNINQNWLYSKLMLSKQLNDDDPNYRSYYFLYEFSPPTKPTTFKHNNGHSYHTHNILCIWINSLPNFDGSMCITINNNKS